MANVTVHFEPALVRPGPMLDWFPSLFATLPWVITADTFGPGVPRRDTAPRVLERFVIEEATYQQRDDIWVGIVTRARRPDTASRYTVIALGVAAKGLIGFRNRLRTRGSVELADVDADLVYGLVRRLATIELEHRNIGGRLIDSAIGYAKRQWRHHLERPSPTDVAGDTALAPVSQGLQLALDRMTRRLAAAGQCLDPSDMELIAATRVDRRHMIDAAAHLGLPLEAAYKRRQRAEQRLARLALDRAPRPSAATPPPTVSPVAATAPEEAESSPRRRAATPTTR